MSVKDLNRDQLTQLKQACLIDWADSGRIDEPSWEDMANPPIPDSVIYEQFAGTIFSEDDFS